MKRLEHPDFRAQTRPIPRELLEKLIALATPPHSPPPHEPPPPCAIRIRGAR